MSEYEQQGRWRRFSTGALAQLREGFFPEFVRGRRAERLLRIVYLPSFEDQVAWEVFKVTSDDPVVPTSFLACRSAWKQMDDWRQFDPPLNHSALDRKATLRRKFYGDPGKEPTLEYASVTPDSALVEKVDARLSAIQVPLRLATPDMVGCDGDTYELTLGNHLSEVTLSWWEEPPAEWREAGALARELLDHLEVRFRAEKAAGSP